MPGLKIFSLLCLLWTESGIPMAAMPVLGVSPCAPRSLDIPWPWCASPSCTKDSWHTGHCHSHAAKQETPLTAGLKCGICCWWIPSSHWATPQQIAQVGCKINSFCNIQLYMVVPWKLSTRSFYKARLHPKAGCHQTWHCKTETGRDQRQEACAYCKCFLTHPHSSKQFYQATKNHSNCIYLPLQ